MNKILLSIVVFLATIAFAQDSIPQMHHKLLLADEGNGKVHYINLDNKSDKWSTTCSNRDLQLVGDNHLMVSDNGGNGYSELDVSTGVLISHVAISSVSSGINSSFRLSKEETFCTRDGSPAKIYTTNATGKIVATITLSLDASVRICRPTAKGTFIIGGKTAGTMCEFDSTGKKIWECNAGGEPYMALRLPDGTTLMSSGYGGQMVRADQKGTVIRKFPTDNDKKSNSKFWDKAKPNFFAGFQILKNGNIVVSNWQGHGTGYGSSGYQLIEIDSALSRVVAFWKQDASFVSSLHNVLIIDDFDTKLLYSDRDGILQPITKPVMIIKSPLPFHCLEARDLSSNMRSALDLLGRSSVNIPPSVYFVRTAAGSGSMSKRVMISRYKN
jgi:hypothetical protein